MISWLYDLYKTYKMYVLLLVSFYSEINRIMIFDAPKVTSSIYNNCQTSWGSFFAKRLLRSLYADLSLF